MKLLKIGFSALILLSFTSCSWREYFVIFNCSNLESVVKYQLDVTKDGFPIFDQEPRAYRIDGNNEIDWNSVQILEDLDSTALGVEIKLPSKSAIIIGELDNDHYKSYSQYFINARMFNIKEIQIVTAQKQITILKNQFDLFFKKVNGTIKYDIKP